MIGSATWIYSLIKNEKRRYKELSISIKSTLAPGYIVTGINPEFLRMAIAKSGAHVYLDSNDACIVNESFIGNESMRF